jgi:hypothetical protein
MASLGACAVKAGRLVADVERSMPRCGVGPDGNDSSDRAAEGEDPCDHAESPLAHEIGVRPFKSG